MQGFFHIPKTDPKKAKLRSCVACGLYKNALSPKMKMHGDGKKGILVIGEAPGEIEDRKGKQWQGKIGKQLQKWLRGFGIDLFRDAYSINAINCRPPNNATPTSAQIMCCRKRVQKAIKEADPNLILLLGNAAVESVIGEVWKKNLGGITKWRGWKIPDQKYKTWICPTFHPSYVMRSLNEGKEQVLTIFKKDLRAALEQIGKPVYTGLADPNVSALKEPEEIVIAIKNKMKEDDIQAFDIETTGLKPHMAGHEIICMAISSDASTVSFPLLLDCLPVLKKYLESNVPKAAANLKFETNWCKEILGVDVRNWVWDTMLAGHLLDNRAGITSLKFQAYVNYGIAGYDEEIEPYLKSKDDEYGGNTPNRIKEYIKRYGIDSVLEYCGYDAYYTRLLTLKQRAILGYED